MSVSVRNGRFPGDPGVAEFAPASLLLVLAASESADPDRCFAELDCPACCEQEARRIPVTKTIGTTLDVNHLAYFQPDKCSFLFLLNSSELLITRLPFFRRLRTILKKNRCTLR